MLQFDTWRPPCRRRMDSRYGNIKFLIQALASGAAPSLSRFYYDQPEFYTTEVVDLVGMVKARARRADCENMRALELAR